jgi:hypothetical protein
MKLPQYLDRETQTLSFGRAEKFPAFMDTQPEPNEKLTSSFAVCLSASRMQDVGIAQFLFIGMQ